MYKSLFLNVLLCTILLICDCIITDIDDDFKQDPKVTRQFKTRCTRRYSPGVCASHVLPVWTYVFHDQNCTERLGCGNHFRGNRFKTYKICMRQCQGLADVYLKMMEDGTNRNYSVPLRKGEVEPPRVNVTATVSEKQEYEVLSQEELEELTYDDYEQGENETHSIVYKDLLNNEDIFPPDVDRVDGEIRSQYDLLHP